MTAAQFELIDETEAEAILRWRFEELVRAGYDIGSALVLARRHGVSLPICQEVGAVLFDGKPPAEALAALLERPLRREDR